MIGHVDEHNRALLDLRVAKSLDSDLMQVTVWIDTAFDGHLVFSRRLIEQLKLESLAETEAILADGSKVTLEAFLCFLDWFGSVIPVQVIANDGKLPLLGTGLLDKRVLRIDYAEKFLSLD